MLRVLGTGRWSRSAYEWRSRDEKAPIREFGETAAAVASRGGGGGCGVSIED